VQLEVNVEVKEPTVFVLTFQALPDSSGSGEAAPPAQDRIAAEPAALREGRQDRSCSCGTEQRGPGIARAIKTRLTAILCDRMEASTQTEEATWGQGQTHCEQGAGASLPRPWLCSGQCSKTSNLALLPRNTSGAFWAGLSVGRLEAGDRR
jgi:hypothetical protein